MLERIRTTLQLADDLIKSVRRISTELRPGILDLGLAAAVEWQAQEFQARTGIPCQLRLPAQEVVVAPDVSTALFRIFQETLTNVARHARSTSVEVILEKQGDRLVLRIRDNEQGFDPADPSLSKSLGLLGMRERAAMLGGQVNISSAPEKGLASPPGFLVSPGSRCNGRCSVRCYGMIRVLIVDDHAILRRGLRALLSDAFAGAKCGEASNAEEALEQLGKEEWDVALLDINLPGKSGLELLKELKAAWPRLPVLVLSVYPEDQFAVRVRKAGAEGYMTKESAPEELVKAIRKILAGGQYVSPTLAEKPQGASWLVENGPRELELLFRAIVFHPSAPILIADNDRHYPDASVGAEKLLGLPREKIIGRSLDDFVDPGFKPVISRTLAGLSETRRAGGHAPAGGSGWNAAGSRVHRQRERACRCATSWCCVTRPQALTRTETRSATHSVVGAGLRAVPA